MLFQKGNKINLGRKQSEEHKRNIGLGHSNEKSYMWKGDNVGYSALHNWIRKNFPKPEICDNCREKKKLDASCATGLYNRDFKNWKYLCRRCHMLSDGRLEKAKYYKLGKKKKY